MLRILKLGSDSGSLGGSESDDAPIGGFGLTSKLSPYLMAATIFAILTAALLLVKNDTIDSAQMSFATLYSHFDLVATIVFAIAGAATAAALANDLPFGAKRDLTFMACAFLTANGGGTLRDALSGTTIFWTQAWIYTVLPLLIGYFASKVSMRCSKNSKTQLDIMDGFAAGIFASSGVIKASVMITPGEPGFVFLAVFMGAMTAAGGGIIRDVFILHRVPSALTSMYGIAAMTGSAVQAQVMVWTSNMTFDDVNVPVWVIGVVVVFLINETTKGWNPIEHLTATEVSRASS